MRKNRVITILLAVMLCMAAFSTAGFAADYFASDETGGSPPPDAIDNISISTEDVKLSENQGSEALTPDGNLTLIDDYLQGSSYYTSEETLLENKQFITVQSKAGNWFYLIIDRSGDTENVYFLNLVDEADLLALMEDGETEADKTEKPEPVAEKPEETEPVAEEPDKTEETEKKSSNSGLIIILIVLALLGGGAYYYFKFVRGKPKTKGGNALNDYDFVDRDEDDTEYETEEEEDADDTESEK